MEINIFQVDAFTSEAFGGNPAGLVPNSRSLTDVQMQKIANEMNVSETAFVVPIDDDLYKVRYFTPTCEVDLCGHGTIATFYALALKGYIKPILNGIKKVYQITKAGKLPVEIKFINNKVDWVSMELAKPEAFGKVEGTHLDDLLDSMNLKPEDLGIGEESLPAEIVSAGLPDIMLPIKSKEVLDSLEIDFCRMSEVCERMNVTGVHAFYLPEKNSPKVFTRNFAPLVGIDEEAATGTANGALTYYLKKRKLIESNSITALQGELLNRPSEISCYIEGEEDDYTIKVAGRAKIVLDGIMIF